MFRVSRLKEHSLSKQVEEKIIRELWKSAPKVQGILISDFVYGVITSHVLETISEILQNTLYMFLVICSAVAKLEMFQI